MRRLYSKIGVSKKNSDWSNFKCLQNIDMDAVQPGCIPNF